MQVPSPWQGCDPWRHGTIEMTQIMNKHWWGDFYKVAKVIYYWYLTCQAHNPGKSFLSPEPSDLLRLNPMAPAAGFIQMPLRDDCQYVLVVVCMSSRSAEVFPCCKAEAFIVSKKVLENVFSTWGLPQSSVMEASTLLGKSYQPDAVPCKCLGIVTVPFTYSHEAGSQAVCAQTGLVFVVVITPH